MVKVIRFMFIRNLLVTVSIVFTGQAFASPESDYEKKYTRPMITVIENAISGGLSVEEAKVSYRKALVDLHHAAKWYLVSLIADTTYENLDAARNDRNNRWKEIPRLESIYKVAFGINREYERRIAWEKQTARTLYVELVRRKEADAGFDIKGYALRQLRGKQYTQRQCQNVLDGMVFLGPQFQYDQIFRSLGGNSHYFCSQSRE